MPKRQKYGGRAKGSKNKSTIQREIEAAALVARAAGHQPAREPALEALERYKRHCEGVAGHLMPNAGVPADLQPKHKDLDKSGEWIDRAIFCARELAKYQTPQLRAILVPAGGMGGPSEFSTMNDDELQAKAIRDARALGATDAEIERLREMFSGPIIEGEVVESGTE